ncbi:MAG: hypothetical protein ACK50J_14825 [Planctomyces sp.]
MTRKTNSSERSSWRIPSGAPLPQSVFLCFAILFTGCGRTEFSLSPVSGTCTCNGEPMTGGLLILAPIRDPNSDSKSANIGKPAQALIQEDGTFTMSTYGEADGAVVGKHKVILNLAVLEEDEDGKKKKQPCKKAAEGLIVEVLPDTNNDLKIDLAGTAKP